MHGLSGRLGWQAIGMAVCVFVWSRKLVSNLMESLVISDFFLWHFCSLKIDRLRRCLLQQITKFGMILLHRRCCTYYVLGIIKSKSFSLSFCGYDFICYLFQVSNDDFERWLAIDTGRVPERGKRETVGWLPFFQTHLNTQRNGGRARSGGHFHTWIFIFVATRPMNALHQTLAFYDFFLDKNFASRSHPLPFTSSTNGPNTHFKLML